MTPQIFTAKLASFYRENARDLPWRQTRSDGSFDPYHILVSEVMLQQTQVARVIPKYQSFLKQFPTVKVLADAPLSEVLREWSGLGYNRRAKYLWQAAAAITAAGAFPQEASSLIKLPGVGSNTAGAIRAYAFNQPEVFIETNIRSVFIHEFFGDSDEVVTDVAIKTLVAQCLQYSSQSPRDFYWALMDYGSYLKTITTNPSRRSKHYTRQSAFQGSKRQIRGQVLQRLHDQPRSLKELNEQIVDQRLGTVLEELLAESLIEKSQKKYQLYNS